EDATTRFLISRRGRWGGGENDRAFFHCHWRATRCFCPRFGRGGPIGGRYLSIRLHPPAAMAIVSRANGRDRIVVTTGRDRNRWLYRCGFRRSDLFSIQQDWDGFGHRGRGFGGNLSGTGAGALGLNGERSCRRGDVGRDRNDESDRANRCSSRARGLSD